LPPDSPEPGGFFCVFAQIFSKKAVFC